MLSLILTILCALLTQETLAINAFSSEFLKEQYQDIIINGKIISTGIRDCNSRYEAIKKILDLYKRPITVLDIGASQGYFSFRIAHDYDATCVMIEDGYDDTWKTSDQLQQLCTLNTDLDNIILLRTRITPQDLEKLGSCEHFDVVLALNIIHHFGAEWKRAADAILNLGTTILIETPPANDTIALHNPRIAELETYLLAKNGKIILETPRHTNPKAKGKLLHFENNKAFLTRPYWFLLPKINYTIYSNYSEKFLIKNRSNEQVKAPWQKGINLLTFCMLNGSYPSKKVLLDQMFFLKEQFDGEFPDFMPWNIIIQGNKAILIDQDDSRFKLDLNKGFQFSVDFLKNESPQDMINWFKENFPKFMTQSNYPFLNWDGYEF